jgi:hypothetical protein
MAEQSDLRTRLADPKHTAAARISRHRREGISHYDEVTVDPRYEPALPATELHPKIRSSPEA